MPVVSHVSLAPPGLTPSASWTPAALGASLVGWWDAQDSASITLNGGNVAAWANKGAAGGALTQTTGASQPPYSATGFDGVRPSLDTTGKRLVGALASAPGSATLAAVYVPTVVGTVTFLGVGNAATNAGAGLGRDFSLGYNAFMWGSQQSSLEGGVAPVVHVAGFGSTVFATVNGTAGSSTSTTTANLSAAVVVGNGAPSGSSLVSGGRIGEVVVVNRVLSPDERQRLEGYLAWRWALQGQLSAGHPWTLTPP